MILRNVVKRTETVQNGTLPEESQKKKSPRSLVGYYPACREAKRAAT